MIVTRILGNAQQDDIAARLRERHVEKVSLAGEDLVKRIQRLSTDHGTEFGLRLPPRSPDLKD